MSEQQPATCAKCQRRIQPSISNRCMYCGEPLPQSMHMSAEQVRVHLESKKNEEHAEFLQGMSGKLPHQRLAEQQKKEKRKKGWRRLLPPFGRE